MLNTRCVITRLDEDTFKVLTNDGVFVRESLEQLTKRLPDIDESIWSSLTLEETIGIVDNDDIMRLDSVIEPYDLVCCITASVLSNDGGTIATEETPEEGYDYTFRVVTRSEEAATMLKQWMANMDSTNGGDFRVVVRDIVEGVLIDLKIGV